MQGKPAPDLSWTTELQFRSSSPLFAVRDGYPRLGRNTCLDSPFAPQNGKAGPASQYVRMCDLGDLGHRQRSTASRIAGTRTPRVSAKNVHNEASKRRP